MTLKFPVRRELVEGLPCWRRKETQSFDKLRMSG